MLVAGKEAKADLVAELRESGVKAEDAENDDPAVSSPLARFVGKSSYFLDNLFLAITIHTTYPKADRAG
jgi:hypothetical protein